MVVLYQLSEINHFFESALHMFFRALVEEPWLTKHGQLRTHHTHEMQKWKYIFILHRNEKKNSNPAKNRYNAPRRNRMNGAASPHPSAVAA